MSKPRGTCVVGLRTILASVVATTSCNGGPQPIHPRQDIPQLFAAIEIGAPRSRVEALLGQPLHEHPERIEHPPVRVRQIAYYLEPRPLAALEAPYMMGAIKIVYDLDERVAEKVLSPHAQ